MSKIVSLVIGWSLLSVKFPSSDCSLNGTFLLLAHFSEWSVCMQCLEGKKNIVLRRLAITHSLRLKFLLAMTALRTAFVPAVVSSFFGRYMLIPIIVFTSMNEQLPWLKKTKHYLYSTCIGSRSSAWRTLIAWIIISIIIPEHEPFIVWFHAVYGRPNVRKNNNLKPERVEAKSFPCRESNPGLLGESQLS